MSAESDSAESDSTDADSTDGDATSTAPSTTTAETTTTESDAAAEYVTEGATVIVANASRVDGGAGLLSEHLTEVGFTVGEATNSADDVENLETTQVFYVTGDAAAQAVAESLGEAFGGDVTVNEVADPAPTASGDLGEATVLVLMGNDTAGKTLEEVLSVPAAADGAATDGDDTEDDAATTEPPTTG